MHLIVRSLYKGNFMNFYKLDSSYATNSRMMYVSHVATRDCDIVSMHPTNHTAIRTEYITEIDVLLYSYHILKCFYRSELS